MYRLLLSLCVLFTACGLTDDPREEDNRNEYIKFTDSKFEAYCLRNFDSNDDKRLSIYEAQRVLSIDCSGLQIASLADITSFTRLQRLDCSRNWLRELDVRGCRALERLNCSANTITWVDLGGLRALRYLDCAANLLARLQFVSNVSLSTIICSQNDLTTLDISNCSVIIEKIDALQNPKLTTLYVGSLQQLRTVNVDGHTQVVDR